MARKTRIIPDVRIIDLGEKGTSIGKTPEGEIVIIQNDAVPGDVINFSVRRKKKGLKFGTVGEYLVLSPDRVEPFCAHFGDCGGCKWQNLQYEKQLFYKEQRVREVIKRIAGDVPEKVKPILGAQLIHSYRNKLEYTFSSKRWLTDEEIASGRDYSERPGLGFHRAGMFDKVIDIQSCHLQDDLGNKIKNAIREFAIERSWSFYDIKRNQGFLRNLILRNSTLNQWMVTMVFGETDQEKIDLFFDVFSSRFPEVSSWGYVINSKMNSSLSDLSVINKSGSTHIQEVLGSIKYNISPKSFFQTNSFQARQLYDLVVGLASLEKHHIVYDLYTGTGSIAIYLARFCKYVVGIEEIPEAVEDARINAKINQVENSHFLVGDVKDVLESGFESRHGVPDLIISDPPRSGMHKDVVSTILTLRAKKIIYISCNPSTQARDILILKERYNLIEVVPVDMFPQTSHIESVALLNLKKC